MLPQAAIRPAAHLYVQQSKCDNAGSWAIFLATEVVVQSVQALILTVTSDGRTNAVSLFVSHKTSLADQPTTDERTNAFSLFIAYETSLAD